MKSKRIITLFYCILLFFNATNLARQKAFCAVPVADLVGEPLTTKKDTNATTHYNTLTLCGGSINPFASCPRMHQLLFNEIVEIIAERNQEAQITIPHALHETQTKKTPHATYWTLKKNLITFDHASKHHMDREKIPQPISFKANNIATNNKNIVTLTRPFYDKETQRTYSAGTRFVLIKKKRDRFAVWAFDNHDFKKIHLPHTHASLFTNSNKTEQTNNFITLLKQWAHPANGVIPYVWGGCSFSGTCKDADFTEIIHQQKSSFVRSSINNQQKTGLDCAGLIVRAAQICNIPYYLKNTATIAKYLDPIQPGEKLNQGDIIFILGHVMIVADLNKNTLIEARAYSHGYGKVHEIPLQEEFKEMKTYADLLESYFSNKQLVRLNKKGKAIQNYPEFKLLKLASIWN